MIYNTSIGTTGGGVANPVEQAPLEKTNTPDTPHLPTELIVIVAEHLIGQFAFGTTANLNLASRAVHLETLPVLYESYFMEYAEQLPYWREMKVLPAGFQFVKYVFYATKGLGAREKWHQTPNAVIGIAVDKSDSSVDTDACHVRVYKPVSMATALKIIETPFRQPVQSHDMCFTNAALESLVYGLSMESVVTSRAKQQCAENTSKPVIRSVDAIRSIRLDKGAYLHANSPIRLQPVITNLRLWYTALQTVEPERTHCIELRTTAIELLKLTGIQAREGRIFQEEERLVRDFDYATYGRPYCVYRRGYFHWHLELCLSLSAAYMIVNQLKEAMDKVPEMAMNRLHLKITQIEKPAELRLLLSRLHDVYASTITSMKHVLPSENDHPEIVRCSPAQIAVVPVQFRNGSHYYPSENDLDGLWSTQEGILPCSGCLRVMLEGDKVSVIVEFEENSSSTT